MRTLLKSKKKGWPEMDQLSRREYEMQKWIEKLDSLAVEFEARWGAGTLEDLAPTEMREKWERQKQKIDNAIISSSVEIMQALFDGTRRGYEAMEDAAMKLGHKPHGAPVAWTIRLEGDKELAIVATHHDAALVQGNCRKDHKLVIWTLEEIANLVLNHGTFKIHSDPVPLTIAHMAEKFDFKEGDEIVF